MTLLRLLLACLSVVLAANAGAYPDKPLKVMHGFAPGGGADILLRAILPKFSENLGQQIVVDYRTGAAGNLAMESVAKAAPDGYTLLMGTPGLATNPSLYEKLPFDPLKDLQPISLIGSVQNVLIVGQDALWSTPEEFAAFLREETEKWRKVIQATGLKAR